MQVHLQVAGVNAFRNALVVRRACQEVLVGALVPDAPGQRRIALPDSAPLKLAYSRG